MIRVNLLGLPKPKKHAPVVTSSAWRSLLLLVVVIAGVAGMQISRYRHLQEDNKRLTKKIREEQAEKIRLQGIRSEYERFSSQKELLQQRINIIEGLKAKQSGPSHLLQTLAKTVSGSGMLWLTRFQQSGQKIQIEGIALNAKAVADFLTQLKDSKAFSDVDLKETFQDNSVKTLQEFIFTVNGVLVNPSPNTQQASL